MICILAFSAGRPIQLYRYFKLNGLLYNFSRGADAVAVRRSRQSISKHTPVLEVHQGVPKRIRYQNIPLLKDHYRVWVHHLLRTKRKVINNVLRYASNNLVIEPQKWHENERRLYVWFIVCYIHMKLFDAIQFIDG